MPPRRQRPARPSRPYALVHAGVRLIAWVTSLASILLLAYVCKEWASKSQVIIAGTVGCAIAMLNDSWEILAVTDASFTVPRLATSRRVLHDLFSLALCIGGIIMMWVSNINIGSDKSADQKRQEMWLMAALWALIAVVLDGDNWRRHTRIKRRMEVRHRRRRQTTNDDWYYGFAMLYDERIY
ncbi:hypothetical protein F53441_5674 [Fusarium austroafricanum]|uniref:Uncharacterized protein n=1 Tax=Fusarium austroafricanum TaxID=2364996 RepID=A0A8H4KHD5_9HYPO|nr:hypothetical protein F53441_5674 [Fusarium austroafricanum]